MTNLSCRSGRTTEILSDDRRRKPFQQAFNGDAGKKGLPGFLIHSASPESRSPGRGGDFALPPTYLAKSFPCRMARNLTGRLPAAPTLIIQGFYLTAFEAPEKISAHVRCLMADRRIMLVPIASHHGRSAKIPSRAARAANDSGPVRTRLGIGPALSDKGRSRRRKQ
jgi:hypothetical protein